MHKPKGRSSGTLSRLRMNETGTLNSIRLKETIMLSRLRRSAIKRKKRPRNRTERQDMRQRSGDMIPSRSVMRQLKQLRRAVRLGRYRTLETRRLLLKQRIRTNKNRRLGYVMA